MELKTLSLPNPNTFRFFADFDVQVQLAAIAELTHQQLGLLRAIVGSPAVIRRIAQMAVETDLADIRGRHVEGLFQGPDNTEILDCVLECLTGSEYAYWNALRSGPGDTLHDAIVPVFLAFEVTLHRAGVKERSTVDVPLSKVIGPILDADEMKNRRLTVRHLFIGLFSSWRYRARATQKCGPLEFSLRSVARRDAPSVELP